MSPAAKRKVTGLAISFVLFVLIAAGGFRKPYSKIADLVLLGLYFVWLLGGSMARVQDRFLGGRETIFRRWRRWLTDDYPASR